MLRNIYYIDVTGKDRIADNFFGKFLFRIFGEILKIFESFLQDYLEFYIG